MAKKLLIAEPFRVAYENIDLPDPGPRQLRVRAVLSGISHGTEMTSFTGKSPFIDKLFDDRMFVSKQSKDEQPFYPFRWAGYDHIGVVEKVGTDVTGYRVGDRVWSSSTHQTHAMLTEGVSEMVKLSDRTSSEDAIMTNLVTVALGAINDAEIHVGDVVAVFGGGTVGQMAAQLAFIAGARRVLLVEPLAERRKIAELNSAVETFDPNAELPGSALRKANGGQAPDVILECSGHVQALQQAVQSAGVGGTVMAVGFYAGPASALCLGEEFLHNRITLKASMSVWGCPYRAMNWDRPRLVREAAHLIAQNRLSFKGFHSASVPFDQAQNAYEAILKEPAKYLKVMLTY